MVRRWLCVPMITACLLLAGCGEKSGTDPSAAEAAREPYQTMESCSMEAEVRYGDTDNEYTFTLSCTYVPDGESTVEVLEPEASAGIRARISGEELSLEYEDTCLPAGTLSTEEISPAASLVRLMEALREGWLLEQNREKIDDVPCLRLSLDQTGDNGSKIVSTLWLREEDGLPERGEIQVDGEIILQVRFTNFTFDGIL